MNNYSLKVAGSVSDEPGDCRLLVTDVCGISPAEHTERVAGERPFYSQTQSLSR